MGDLSCAFNPIACGVESAMAAGVSEPVQQKIESLRANKQGMTASEGAGMAVGGLFGKAMLGVGELISGAAAGGHYNHDHARIIESLAKQGVPGFIAEEYLDPHTGEKYKIYIDASNTAEHGGETSSPVVMKDGVYNRGTAGVAIDSGSRSQEALNAHARRLQEKAEGQITEMLGRGATPEDYAKRIVEGAPSPEAIDNEIQTTKEVLQTGDPDYREGDLAASREMAEHSLDAARRDALVTGTPESAKVLRDMEQDKRVLDRMIETGQIPPDQRASYIPQTPQASTPSFG